MDFDLPGDRGRTTVPVPPGMALAIATIVAAGVTGLAVAGLTWTLDHPTGRVTGAPPDVTAFSQSPEPSAVGPIDTPGWDEALGLPAPAPVPSGGMPVEGVGTVAAPTGTPAQEEAVRRAAAARRPLGPLVGPTASVRSTPDAATAATSTAAAPSATATTAPGAAPGAGDATPVVTGPATAHPGPNAEPVQPAAEPAADPDADAGPDTGPAFEPTATETTAPQRRWEQPRRTWRDEPRQAPAPAPAPQWGGPFGDFPRMFPWG